MSEPLRILVIDDDAVMTVAWRVIAEQNLKQPVNACRIAQIVAAHDIGDGLGGVIDHNGEMVARADVSSPEQDITPELGLGELGVNTGDRVAIFSENRPEWAIADYACLNIGAADVPMAMTRTASDRTSAMVPKLRSNDKTSAS